MTFVTLKEWADSGSDLLPFIDRQFTLCGFPQAKSFIEHILSHTDKALVLFDGLDEVQKEDNARARILAGLRDFGQQYHRARCLLTCRAQLPSRMRILSPSSSMRSVFKFFVPLGRPWGLPDWPGFKRVCSGGLPYPTS